MVADPKITGELTHFRDAIEAELGPHEYLVWVGQPRPSRVIQRGWIPIIFACFYLAIVFFLFWLRIRELPGGMNDPELLTTTLIFTPFIFAGGYLLTKPLRDINKATHLYYLITNKRALILVHRKTTFIKAFSDKDLSHAILHHLPDGSGDIWLCHKGKRQRLNGYIGLEDVEEVGRHLEAIGATVSRP